MNLDPTRAGPRALVLLLLSVAACGGSDAVTADAAPGLDGAAATACSAVDIADSYPEATSAGPCTSPAGVAIASSLMNLDGVTIDNNGTTMTPCVSVQCDDTYAYIVGNGLPHYDFVQTTPNALTEDLVVYRIPLAPSAPASAGAVDIDSLTGCEDAHAAFVSGVAPNREPAGLCANAATGTLVETVDVGTRPLAQIACLGPFGTLINGVNANGPNEATMPDPWGDPAFSSPDDATSGEGILDFCGGHTGQNMHYHTVHAPCFETDDVGRPSRSYVDAVLGWRQRGAIDDACTTESPILGWSFDGYPIKGPCVCLARDAGGACTSVKRARSSWQYDGLSAYGASPAPALALEGAACDTDATCCPGGAAACDLRCNHVLTDGAEAGTAVNKVCTVLDYAWCTSAYHDRTAVDTGAEDFVYMDRCNGYDGADGFAYHATGSFPYLQGCFRGAPAAQAAGGGPPGGGPPGGGPPGAP